MNWNPKTWKFDWKNKKERWLILLAAGLILLLLAFPSGREAGGNVIRSESRDSLQPQAESSGPAASFSDADYERQLEQRLEEMLGKVDGVGDVEVMVVLSSSEEKVWHVDQDSSYSRTEETDSEGGSRRVESQELARETVLAGQNGSQEALLQKEIRPEISGVVVSAEGGGSSRVQAEISAAVEALFGLPAHRVKVLKMKG